MANNVNVELKDLSWEEVQTKATLEKSGKEVNYYPMLIEGREQLEMLGITWDQCRTWRIGGERKIVHLSPCDQETYNHLVRDRGSQMTRDRRNSRCLVPGKQKPLIRCPETNKCDACPFGITPWNRKANVISVDQMAEDRCEPSDDISVEKQVFQRMALHDLKAMLDEKDTRLYQIFVLMNLDGYNISDVAREFQISRTRVKQLIQKIDDMLSDFRNKWS